MAINPDKIPFRLVECDVCGMRKDAGQVQWLRDTLASEGIRRVCDKCIAQADELFYEPLRKIFIKLKKEANHA